MAWVKLTDDFTENHKILDAGPLASWLWVSAIAWSNRNGTRGVIPTAQISRLCAWDGIGVYEGQYAGDDVSVWKLVDQLVAVGLFEDHERGWKIHDYEEFQQTPEQIEANRQKKAEAGRAGGLASAESRRGAARSEATGRAGAVPHGQPPAEADASPPAEADRKPESRSRNPVDSPVVSRPVGLEGEPDPTTTDVASIDPRWWQNVADRLALLEAKSRPANNKIRDVERYATRILSNIVEDRGADVAALIAADPTLLDDPDRCADRMRAGSIPSNVVPISTDWCPTCDGTGRDPDALIDRGDELPTCPDCKGSGKVAS